MERRTRQQSGADRPGRTWLGDYCPTCPPKRIVMAEQTRGAEVVIRRATIDDAEVLSALGARLFEQAFGAANTPEDMRAFLASTFSPAAQRAEIRDPERATFV